MFQRGKEVHQPGRKLSNQFGDPLSARRTSTGSTGGGGLEKTDSIPEPGSQGQRRRVSFAVFPIRPAQCCGPSPEDITEDVHALQASPNMPPAFHHHCYSAASIIAVKASSTDLCTLVLRRLSRPFRQPYYPEAWQRRLQRAPCQLHRDGRQLPRSRKRLVQPDFQGPHGQAWRLHGQRWQDDGSRIGAAEERGEEGCYGVSLWYL